LYVTTIDEKEGMNLKVSKEEYMIGFKGRKSKTANNLLILPQDEKKIIRKMQHNT